MLQQYKGYDIDYFVDKTFYIPNCLELNWNIGEYGVADTLTATELKFTVRKGEKGIAVFEGNWDIVVIAAILDIISEWKECKLPKINVNIETYEDGMLELSRVRDELIDRFMEGYLHNDEWLFHNALEDMMDKIVKKEKIFSIHEITEEELDGMVCEMMEKRECI